ncbi:MAG: hypothetical protein KKA90_00015, partial [Nanoarchaeota archaeon]|nr:hypothetical protein [Nanoarchaeota archaeon]
MDRYGINFELTNLGGRSDELAGESLFPLGPARALYEVGLLRKWGHPPSDISEDRIQRGTALYNFVHANRGCGNIAATGIDQRAEGENYPATVLDFPNFQKDPETGVYRMEHTANSRKGETTIVPSGFVLFVPGEKRLYD